MDLDFAVESSGTKCILVRAGNSRALLVTARNHLWSVSAISNCLVPSSRNGRVSRARAREREREREIGGRRNLILATNYLISRLFFFFINHLFIRGQNRFESLFSRRFEFY